MNQTTEAGIVALCNADKTITPDQLRAILDAGRGEVTGGRSADALGPYTRKEAARVLRCCPTSITNYCRAGMIRRIYGPRHGMSGKDANAARGRGVRYCRADVDRIARGEPVATAADAGTAKRTRTRGRRAA